MEEKNERRERKNTLQNPYIYLWVYAHVHASNIEAFSVQIDVGGVRFGLKTVRDFLLYPWTLPAILANRGSLLPLKYSRIKVV